MHATTMDSRLKKGRKGKLPNILYRQGKDLDMDTCLKQIMPEFFPNSKKRREN